MSRQLVARDTMVANLVVLFRECFERELHSPSGRSEDKQKGM